MFFNKNAPAFNVIYRSFMTEMAGTKLFNIALFASGSGTNAENICNYFKQNKQIKVALIVTNNALAGVIKRAKRLHVPVEVIAKEAYSNGNYLTQLLKNYKIDFVVLAGYLKLIPLELIKNYERRIINIHPALLPLYGGHGMYGMKVHEAVITAGEKQTGITIHYVNEKFDEGKIIFQATTSIVNTDTPHSIADKVHKLEYEYFPKVIEDVILSCQESL